MVKEDILARPMPIGDATPEYFTLCKLQGSQPYLRADSLRDIDRKFIHCLVQAGALCVRKQPRGSEEDLVALYKQWLKIHVKSLTVTRYIREQRLDLVAQQQGRRLKMQVNLQSGDPFINQLRRAMLEWWVTEW
jgi:hypothetical protein